MTMSTDGDALRISGKIERGTATFSRPALPGRLGGPINIKVSDADGRDFALSMVVREVAPRPLHQ